MKAIKVYSDNNAGRAIHNTIQILILSIFGGFFVAAGAMASGIASFGIANVSVARIVASLFFPIGIVMIVITKTKLFTGNCLAVVAVADKKMKIRELLRQWFLVYIGNFLGSVLLAWAVVKLGQLELGNNELLKSSLQIANSKCEINAFTAILSGFFCNVLVCIAILMSMESKELISRVVGAYVPVVVFVIAGFEHSVANMFFISRGIFALQKYDYMSSLFPMINWGNFGWNLLFVTLGNIIGGTVLGLGMRYSSIIKAEKQ